MAAVMTAEPLQDRSCEDFVTGRPAVWHNKDGSTSPKYSAIIERLHDAAGLEVALWRPADLDQVTATLGPRQQRLPRWQP
jgi:hypothetical protein